MLNITGRIILASPNNTPLVLYCFVISCEPVNFQPQRCTFMTGKDGDVAARLVASLARNLGQATRHKTIIRDMYGEEDGSSAITKETLASYLALLKTFYLIDEVLGWVPPMHSRKRLAVKPKRYFADPSLAAAQLGMDTAAIMHDWQTFGLLFESLCVRDLMVYARARIPRDNNGCFEVRSSDSRRHLCRAEQMSICIAGTYLPSSRHLL